MNTSTDCFKQANSLINWTLFHIKPPTKVQVRTCHKRSSHPKFPQTQKRKKKKKSVYIIESDNA